MSARALYQKTILDHNRNPYNFMMLPEATHQARGLNALCGDDLTVFMKLSGSDIEKVSFLGDACAISMASASMMCQYLERKTEQQARDAFSDFEALMLGDIEESSILGELNVMKSVRQNKARIKSARLCWHAMLSALDGIEQTTTEK